LLFGLPVLGFCGGFALIDPQGKRAVGRWESLDAPPEPAVEFVDADLGFVSVRGQDGSTFECVHWTGETGDNACWKNVEQSRKSIGGTEHGVSYGGKMPSPPGPVVESLDLIGHEHRESTTYVRYVLLEDGTVWFWTYYTGSGKVMATLLGGPIFGLALAVVLIVGIWLVVGVRALVKRRRER
jgi:hypothetical protein